MRDDYRQRISSARKLFNSTKLEPIANETEANRLYDIRSKILELISDPENRAEDLAHTKMCLCASEILKHIREYGF